MRTRLFLLAALAALLFPACDQSGVRQTTFEATLTGAVTATLRGAATAGETRQFELAMYEITLSAGLTDRITFFREAGAALRPGTYALGDSGGSDARSGFDALVIFAGPPSSPLPLALMAQAGTLTVSSVGGGVVEGSFRFTATPFFPLPDGTEGGPTEVVGTFLAAQL